MHTITARHSDAAAAGGPPERVGTTDPTPIEGLVDTDGRDHYVIPDVDRMPPFLMSIVSDGDRWMFASSGGALTAGRRDAAGAIFPYETDDRLHTAAGSIGPVTTMRVDGRPWRPFAPTAHPVGRTLYKSVAGDSVAVEERHPESGLRLRTRWSSCDRYGFVRSATLVNDGDRSLAIELLDGVVNLLPAGLDPVTTQRLSNLSNAYKRSEVVDLSRGLAVYSLEAPVSDRAEPEEVLRSTVAWSVGLEHADGVELTLDPSAVARFERGDPFDAEHLLTGRPGAHLSSATLTLRPGEERSWRLVVDAQRSQSDVARLRRQLAGRPVADIVAELDRSVTEATEALVRVMDLADAAQSTGDPIADAHHVANVTYNVMRGGVPLDGYRIGVGELCRFVAQRNRHVAARHEAWLRALPSPIDRSELLDRVAGVGDPHLARLVREYLPFSFSRRHGDPSRPWNSFSIRVRDEAGEPIVRYEGNWRDVFQNWEALALSHPGYLDGMVSTFVNATTVDGFNPYRITTEGIDWEVPDPHDPWANIGYWGDHQVIYLLRLLDAAERTRPGSISAALGERTCTFADVPYRLAPYEQLLADPKATIDFDEAAAAAAAARVELVGGDGKLVVDADGEIVLATLLEKLLITSLAKLSNFVPGGGIWMNTQRPEWNDANNALVGYGLSMVTLYHLRQFLDRLRTLVAAGADSSTAGSGGRFDVASEVAEWLERVVGTLTSTPVQVDDDATRRFVLDELGRSFSDYRSAFYAAGRSGERVTVTADRVDQLCSVAIAWLDATIRTSRRDDGLYHSYNVLRFDADPTVVGVDHLPVMLEGQVAVLGSGGLSPAERADVVDALFASDLHRADQDSFLLAPVRSVPSFLDKNVVPAGAVSSSPLLRALIAAGDESVVVVDVDGVHRFHPDLVDEPALLAALERLADRPDGRWTDLVAAEGAAVADVFESVFGHRAFLGRSGAMYAYEGIGSIYWHMVTKLLLAVQESVVDAADSGSDRAVVERLVAAYRRVVAGLGYHKSAADFGAIPTDPYSHTPAHAGAQQPGMTGAVKEELLARPLELGGRVVDGELTFDGVLVEPSALTAQDRTWSVSGVDGVRRRITVPAGACGWTHCQVPIVVTIADGDPSITVEHADGRVETIAGRRLGRDLSAAVFGRTGEVVSIRATLPAR